VIADWGTGLDDAKWLLSEVMKKNPDVLLHLGDVYYSGTADEFRGNFLDPITRSRRAFPFIRCLAITTHVRGGARLFGF